MRAWNARCGAAAALIASVVASSGSAVAVEKGGVVVDVSQFAAVDGTAGARTLVVDGPVYMGDVIRTGPKGTAQILLRDDTRLVVGPSSYMTVDSFVFSGDKARDISLNAVRGAFRFITGLSAKQAYEIRTPSATIGVRGTRFDFSIDWRGRMALALYEGAAQLCNRRKECIVVSGTCSVALTQRFRPTKPLSPDEQRGLLSSAFPFLEKQKTLKAAFQVDTSDCDVQPAAAVLRDANGVPIQVRGGSFGFSSVSFGSLGGGVAGTTTGNNNRSGLGDNTNPGGGSSNNNASSGGSQNPGGGGNGH
jgi:hypothetical protein